jgi:hypothetical protein
MNHAAHPAATVELAWWLPRCSRGGAYAHSLLVLEPAAHEHPDAGGPAPA